MNMRTMLGSVLLSFALSTAAFAASEAILTSGTGELVRAEKAQPLKTGAAFQAGDVVRTGAKDTVDVSINGLAGVRVLPSSTVSIAGVATSDMNVKVETGNVILNLAQLPAGSHFKVETPTAIASVRGTQFWGRVDSSAIDNPITTFAVREGRVKVLSKISGESFDLEAGKALDLPKTGKALPKVRSALPEELQAMQQADTIRTAA